MKTTGMIIDAYIFYYGGSRRAAAEMLKTYSDERRAAILEGYKEQINRAIYAD